MALPRTTGSPRPRVRSRSVGELGSMSGRLGVGASGVDVGVRGQLGSIRGGSWIDAWSIWAVDLASSQGQLGVESGPIWGPFEADVGSISASSRSGPDVDAGSIWGRLGSGLDSIWGLTNSRKPWRHLPNAAAARTSGSRASPPASQRWSCSRGAATRASDCRTTCPPPRTRTPSSGARGATAPRRGPCMSSSGMDGARLVPCPS